jgi:phenylalanyl-tRNA synthetase beta chain
VLLESAYFNPQRIGHTSRRLGVVTDASMRFERGADCAITDATSVIAGDLFKRYASARQREFIGLGKKTKVTKVRFPLSRLNKILSLDLTAKKVKDILKKIDVIVVGRERLTATIPHYRRDLSIEEDIYEEVARVYGYMNIPDAPPQRWAGEALFNTNRLFEETIKNYLVGLGFSETYNLSLVPSKRLAEFYIKNFVKIRNPLNERFNALRPTLFFGLIDCVNYNRSKGNNSLKLFEIGNILLVEPPFQEKRLGAIMGGQRYPDFWNRHDEEIDYFDAKGVVEAIFLLVRMRDLVFKPVARQGLSQAVSIVFSGKELGYLGCIDTSLCEGTYFYFELALQPIWSFVSPPFYMPPAKFPANTRDLSFLVGEEINAPDVINLVTKVGGPVLEKVNLFDYYKGNNLPQGKKSLGLRLYFRAPDRTLTDKEVNNFIRKITDEVVGTFQATLRTKEHNWTN